MTVRSICLHGPESTGKSTIGPRLAAQFGTPLIGEYGRDYAEMHGTDFAMADLVSIAKGHDMLTREALARGRYPVILDTDPLMTAVWADMMFGRRDPWLAAWNSPADLYLLFDIDLPWQADSVRIYGGTAERARFMDLSRRELERRGVRWALVTGEGSRRYLNALDAIRAAS